MFSKTRVRQTNLLRRRNDAIMKQKLQNKKGFTLAELLIVVAIIAVLMAIMIPVFGNSRAAAILGKDAANLRSIYSEAVSTEMGDDANYDANGILFVDLQAFVNKATDVEFDGTTRAQYKAATIDASGKITAPAEIVVRSTKIDNTYEIKLDSDMVIEKSGSALTQAVNSYDASDATKEGIDLNNVT